MKLEGKVIAVTGGNGLLGKTICNYLRQHKANVICADIVQSAPDKNNIVVDITDENSVKNAVQQIAKDFGRIDGWVNNAYPRTADWGNKIEDVPVESWRKNVDMHLNGYFICCKLVLEQMKKQKGGVVVNMSSIYGIVGPDFSIYGDTGMTSPVAYSAIKGGLINLTRYLASYFGKDNIRVNCVSPGGIFDSQPEVFVKNYEQKVPMRRLGKPGDIAPSVAFLLSDEASYISGHNLVVDGGWTAI